MIKTDASTASAVVTVSNSNFFGNQQIAVNWCTTMVFKDVWVGGCGTVNCSANMPLFENWSGLYLERMTGAGSHGVDTRWIDNNGHEAQLSARDSRFGGEGGGMLIVLNRASFLCVPNSCSGHCAPTGPPCNCSVGEAGGCSMPPGKGALPASTHLSNMPQGSSILIDNCAIDSYATMNGGPCEYTATYCTCTGCRHTHDISHCRRCRSGPGCSNWNTSIFLEQIPQVLIVRDSLGLAYTPAFSGFPYKLPLTLVRVDPKIDLDGAQLDYAARYPNTLKFNLGQANDWAPEGYLELPEQLQPYATSMVYGDGAPTAGSRPPNTRCDNIQIQLQ